MLQFEDLVVNNFLYWKDECIWGKNQKSIWIMHCWSMYNIYIYIYFFITKCINVRERAKSSNFCSQGLQIEIYNSATLHLSKKNLRGATEKKTNKKPNVLLKILGLLVIKLVNLLVFERISWLIISNWSFQKKNANSDLEMALTS